MLGISSILPDLTVPNMPPQLPCRLRRAKGASAHRPHGAMTAQQPSVVLSTTIDVFLGAVLHEMTCDMAGPFPCFDA